MKLYGLFANYDNGDGGTDTELIAVSESTDKLEERKNNLATKSAEAKKLKEEYNKLLREVNEENPFNEPTEEKPKPAVRPTTKEEHKKWKNIVDSWQGRSFVWQQKLKSHMDKNQKEALSRLSVIHNKQYDSIPEYYCYSEPADYYISEVELIE